MAYAAAYEYAEVEDILKIAEEKGEPPFLFLLDGIEDPHNLGAIIRTANLAGAHGVIIPKRRAVGLTATVARTSAGALNYTTGREGHEYGGDHRGFKETRDLVRLCRYGRREHVPFKSHRTDRSCDRK